MSTTEIIYQSKGVKFTDLGADKVRELLPDGADPASAGLRIEVRPGGCTGFQYGLAFDHLQEGDAVFEDHGLRILIDNRSLPYIDGSTIDCVDALQGLQVNNPNVVASCGCGSSFQVTSDEQHSTV
jgi:iron-sulfur cluster assembly protein